MLSGQILRKNNGTGISFGQQRRRDIIAKEHDKNGKNVKAAFLKFDPIRLLGVNEQLTYEIINTKRKLQKQIAQLEVLNGIQSMVAKQKQFIFKQLDVQLQQSLIEEQLKYEQLRMQLIRLQQQLIFQTRQYKNIRLGYAGHGGNISQQQTNKSKHSDNQSQHQDNKYEIVDNKSDKTEVTCSQSSVKKIEQNSDSD